MNPKRINTLFHCIIQLFGTHTTSFITLLLHNSFLPLKNVFFFLSDSLLAHTHTKGLILSLELNENLHMCATV